MSDVALVSHAFCALATGKALLIPRHDNQCREQTENGNKPCDPQQVLKPIGVEHMVLVLV